MMYILHMHKYRYLLIYATYIHYTYTYYLRTYNIYTYCYHQTYILVPPELLLLPLTPLLLPLHSPLPDDEPRPHLVDDLDQADPVPAVGEEVVDVEPVDVQRVDPHAEHALLSVVIYTYR